MTNQNERLKRGAMELRGLIEEIEEKQQQLDELIENRKRFERVVLPELFAEAGLKVITLPDGSKITLTILAEGSLPKEPDKRAAAIDWLVANGYEELIENKVTASWSRSDRDKARAEYERLAALGTAKVLLAEGIHSMTLGARMRDRVVAGQPTPLELLGVEVFQRARFTKTAGNRSRAQSSRTAELD